MCLCACVFICVCLYVCRYFEVLGIKGQDPRYCHVLSAPLCFSCTFCVFARACVCKVVLECFACVQLDRERERKKGLEV